MKAACLQEVRSAWTNWLSQVPVFGFNSGKYNLNMAKYYFVKTISDLSNVKVAKKDNSYMFLITARFKFLDVRNYLVPIVSYDGWCKANGCEMQKLVFPYEWLDDYERLSHVGPVLHEALYSEPQGNITRDEYDKFVQDFSERGCKTMMDWLKVHNEADVILFIEVVDKTRKQYYPDEIDMLSDVVSIPGISMTYVLNKSPKMKQPGEPELLAPGQPCSHKCTECEINPKPGCEKCKKVQNDCTQCAKNKPYELHDWRPKYRFLPVS